MRAPVGDEVDDFRTIVQGGQAEAISERDIVTRSASGTAPCRDARWLIAKLTSTMIKIAISAEAFEVITVTLSNRHQAGCE
jgi:hypothetical protein